MGLYRPVASLTMTVEVPSLTCTFWIRPFDRMVQQVSVLPRPCTKKRTKASALAAKKYGVTVLKLGEYTWRTSCANESSGKGAKVLYCKVGGVSIILEVIGEQSVVR